MNERIISSQTAAAERFNSMNRRHFLRGVGACLALPAFASLGGGRLMADSAKRTAAKAPVRMAFLYVPNGTIPSAWWPAGEEGKEFDLSRTLEPLSGLRSQIQVLAGLDDRCADPGVDGAGDHARAGGTFLTGVRIRKTAGADIFAGPSIDQVVAQQIGHLTRFPSLELTCDGVVRKTGNCDSGYSCAYEYNIAWKSPTQPMAPEPNPRFVFERLFGSGGPSERAANLDRRRQEQRSILDFVMQDAATVHRKLNGRDRDKLDHYLTSVREIEQRLEAAERMSVPNVAADCPQGMPGDYMAHIHLMFDMLVLAFQTDSTRIATLLLAREGSNRPFSELGYSQGHHDLTHHQNRDEMIEKVKEIDLWYVQQLAVFLDKMQKTQDIDGNSLLHNSMIMYGSGNADGNRHTHVNLPIVLAGTGGGRLQPGAYRKFKAAPLTNLLLTMADHMGARGIQTHGDSTGRLEGV